MCCNCPLTYEPACIYSISTKTYSYIHNTHHLTLPTIWLYYMYIDGTCCIYYIWHQISPCVHNSHLEQAPAACMCRFHIPYTRVRRICFIFRAACSIGVWPRFPGSLFLIQEAYLGPVCRWLPAAGIYTWQERRPSGPGVYMEFAGKLYVPAYEALVGLAGLR